MHIVNGLDSNATYDLLELFFKHQVRICFNRIDSSIGSCEIVNQANNYLISSSSEVVNLSAIMLVFNPSGFRKNLKTDKFFLQLLVMT